LPGQQLVGQLLLARLAHEWRVQEPGLADRDRELVQVLERAEELVEDHANGALSGIELKYGVGYVPPAPENYQEVADRLDAARRRPRDDYDPAEPSPEPAYSAPPSRTTAPRLSDVDVDGYVLGAFLFHSATERTRKLLRIAGEADAHEYARSLHPAERLAALRSLAREAIEAA